MNKTCAFSLGALFLATATISHAKAIKKLRAIGVCEIADTWPDSGGGVVESARNLESKIVLRPRFAAANYLVSYEGATLNFISGWAVSILDHPDHGELRSADQEDADYDYVPDRNFEGEDTVIFKAVRKGIRIDIHYSIHVVEYRSRTPYDDNCGTAENPWKIR